MLACTQLQTRFHEMRGPAANVNARGGWKRRDGAHVGAEVGHVVGNGGAQPEVAYAVVAHRVLAAVVANVDDGGPRIKGQHPHLPRRATEPFTRLDGSCCTGELLSSLLIAKTDRGNILLTRLWMSIS